MTSRDPSDPARQPGWLDDEEELISSSQLFRSEGRASEHDEDQELGDTVRLPKITRMPEGVEVKEESLGRATAQWILEVRCQCGRRWFELQEVVTARCPRCDKLVRVKVE